MLTWWVKAQWAPAAPALHTRRFCTASALLTCAVWNQALLKRSHVISEIFLLLQCAALAARALWSSADHALAQVRPHQIFTRTLSKNGRKCDHFGRSLEPWSSRYSPKWHYADAEETNCWIKSLFLFSLRTKKYSRSFIKLRLKHWWQMDYFDDVFHTFLAPPAAGPGLRFFLWPSIIPMILDFCDSFVINYLLNWPEIYSLVRLYFSCLPRGARPYISPSHWQNFMWNVHAIP